MSRTVEQILDEQHIELSPRLIRTRDATVSVGDAWVLTQYHWPGPWTPYADGPSPLAVAALVASIWILAAGIPPNLPWLVPLCIAAAVGALWSIGLWLINRSRYKPQPEQPSRGITFSLAGSEGAVTLFQSDDEQEIELLRRKLEETLLPARTNGD